MKLSGHVTDIHGGVFGRLTVIAFSHISEAKDAYWRCRCQCGGEVVVRGTELRNGGTRSCGCLQRDETRRAATTHGLSGGRARSNRLYRIWQNMLGRCRNPNASKYHLYGGRGISVCGAWQEYVPFHEWAMSNGYRDDLTLDRVDGDGNYEPGNCQWTTFARQGRYTRNRRLITFQGETRSVTEWAERLGMKTKTLSARINDYGWEIEKALTTPVAPRRNHR